MKRTHVVFAGLAALASMLGEAGAAPADEAASLLDVAAYRSLVAEDKAARVGDVLTVIVYESATASSSADLRADRNFSVSGLLSPSGGSVNTSEGSSATHSDGTGRTQRSGRLLAQISVRVTGVNENGDLIVSGQQSLQINRERQLITLSGVVRPRDIGDSNTVLSSRIADARIQFDGKGFVARQSRAGWIAWLLSFLGF